MASLFVKLSPELRKRIYSLVLQQDAVISIDKIKDYNTLINTCRKIRAETLTISFAHNTFVMERFTKDRFVKFIEAYGVNTICWTGALKFKWDIMDQIVVGCHAGAEHAMLEWQPVEGSTSSYTDVALHQALEDAGLEVLEAHDDERRLWMISPFLGAEEDEDDLAFGM